MAIVYRHRRLDNNTIFYIGIGINEKRAFQTDQLTDIKVFWINYIERNLSHFLPIEGDYKEFY